MKKSAIAAIVALLAGACDQGEDQQGQTEQRSVLEDVDTDAVNTTLDPNEFPVFHFSSLQKPYEDSAGCLAFAEAKGDTTERTKCQCEKCLEQLQECDVLQGCNEIKACSNETGCNDEFSCYLLASGAAEKCVAIIDRWGNASLAVSVSIGLMDCSRLNKCQ